ncbi:MAG: hydrolase [Pseudomonadota bacterium]
MTSDRFDPSDLEIAGVPVDADGRSATAWTGSRLINLADPDPADVILEDVARNLSRTMRYNGGTRDAWSVLDHLLVCDRIAAAEGLPRAERRAVILHDAAEWITGDMSRPVKIMVPEFRAFEAHIWRRAIAPRFDLPEDLPSAVKRIDNEAAAAEGLDLFDPPQRWPGLPAPREVARQRFAFGPPAQVAARFLRRCAALGIK